MPLVGRRQPREQHGDAGPERPAADSDHDGHQERLPGLVHERHEREAERRDQQGTGERPPSAEAVDQRPDCRGGGDPDQAQRRDDESGGGQAEAADVVEVDEQERERDPTPEEVDEGPDLEDPDCARQLRVEPADVCAEAGHVILLNV